MKPLNFKWIKKDRQTETENSLKCQNTKVLYKNY